MNNKVFPLLLISAFFSSVVNAKEYEMPANCELDGNVSYDFSINNLEQQIELGYDIYQDPSSTTGDTIQYSNWLELISNLLNSWDSVEVSGPKHVLQGQTFTAKGEAFLDPFVNIKFSNSEKGYVGTDKTSIETNAYKSMNFDRTYGVGLIWAHRASGLCSSQSVWVQKAPEIISGSASVVNSQIRTNVTYDVDKYSKASKDSNTDVKVMLISESDLYGTGTSTTVSSSSLSGTISINTYPHAGGGPYQLSLRVYDGTFNSETYDLGMVFVPGSSTPPCEGCNKN